MAYCWTIFPLILFSTSHLPCYPLPIPLCTPLSSPGRDTKGPVRHSNQELPWMAGAHISPSIPRYLSWQNSSRCYDWEGSTEKLKTKPLALKIKCRMDGNATPETGSSHVWLPEVSRTGSPVHLMNNCCMCLFFDLGDGLKVTRKSKVIR